MAKTRLSVLEGWKIANYRALWEKYRLFGSELWTYLKKNKLEIFAKDIGEPKIKGWDSEDIL